MQAAGRVFCYPNLIMVVKAVIAASQYELTPGCLRSEARGVNFEDLGLQHWDLPLQSIRGLYDVHCSVNAVVNLS